jgi:isopentenyl diphosphate isomerase/L-lactate dehydrogenase-like FMN-dependent dehydrogenase
VPTHWSSFQKNQETRLLFFQLYTPNDRELAESFVHRAAVAGLKGLVVTSLYIWVTGWRLRDLNQSSFPQLRGSLPGKLFFR